MITGEQMLEELIQLEPSRLDENTQKLFYTIMKLIDERDELRLKYNKVLTMLANHCLPCELDDFMNKNTDYCIMNCSEDEEIFKKCWDRYIEQRLEGNNDN